MTNYNAWDSKASALVEEADAEDKKEEAESNRALGLEAGPQGPTTAKASAELKELDEKSKKRQEFIDWSKEREVTLTHSRQEEPVKLSGIDAEGKAVRFSGSEGVTYVVDKPLVKLMFDKCKQVKVEVRACIVTSTVELYKCEEFDLDLREPVATLQVDECAARTHVAFSEREHIGRIYHQNSPGLAVSWAGAEAQCIGLQRAAQFCTRLGPEGASEPFATEPVRRGEGEYPIDLPNGGQEPAAGQPEPEKPPAAEELKRLAEQQRQVGNEMFRANDFMQAAAHYTQSIQLDPSVGAVFANRAQCWMKLGDHEKALEDAGKCTEVDPANPKGWFRKGMSLHAMKRYPEAIPALLEAERLEPQNKQVVDAIKMAQMMARKSAAGA